MRHGDDVAAAVGLVQPGDGAAHPLDEILERLAARRALMGRSQPEAVPGTGALLGQLGVGQALPVAKALLAQAGCPQALQRGRGRHLREDGIGGLSGAVLSEKSFAIFDAVAKELYGKTTLISVGGISTAEDAYRRIKAGASLVQVLSGLIFEGPELIKDINNGLIDLIKADGYSSITEAIGSAR